MKKSYPKNLAYDSGFHPTEGLSVSRMPATLPFHGGIPGIPTTPAHSSSVVAVVVKQADIPVGDL